jgi:phytoene dehydrogenase-like protein
MSVQVSTVDAVVIGSGPNGLTAANLLADAGWDVLVLEAAGVPGGAVRSAELTAPGFVNDVFSAFYPLGRASPVLSGFGLERHGLRWTHAPVALAHLLPDDRVALLSRDLDVTAASVEAFAPGDGDAWRAAFADWQELREPLLRSLFTPFPPVRGALGLAAALGPADGLRRARMLVQPARVYAEELFAGAGARLLLAGNALHSDLGPGQAGSAVFGWLLSMLAQDVGFPVPEGGAGELTAALVRRLRAAGGELACDRPVTRVLVADGRAIGVRDAAGGLVRARRAVLAAVPAPALYRDLVGVEHLPPRLVEDLGRFRWDDGTIKVDWALSGPIPWRNPDVSRAGTVHLAADLAGLDAFGAALAAGTVPADPFLLLGQMTTADPSRSPAGTESAWAYTHVPRRDDWDADAVRGQVDAVERVIEARAPGFTSRILARHVAGPREFQAANPALVGGALNGGTAALHQQLFFRPVPGLGRADTPVDRLFLAGASAHPGGAVHGGPGANAARAALARSGPAGPLYAATIATLHRRLYA